MVRGRTVPVWVVRSVLSRAVGVLLVVGLGLSACSRDSDATPDDGEPVAVAMLTVDDMKTFGFPLDPYVYSHYTQPSYARAFAMLYGRCMARFGFTSPPDLPRRPPPLARHESRYGVTNENEVKVHGYHPAFSDPDEPSTSPSPISPAELAVGMGEGGQRTHRGQPVPEGGCRGEAQSKLEAGAPAVEDIRLGETLANDSFGRALEDSRVRAVTDEWSACMTGRGYDYATPEKANNDPAFATESPTSNEIAVALADVRCKKETNYINIRASVETAYQQRALEKNAEALELVRKSFEIQERNAAKVIASG
jgi:hypothetical protein